MTLLEVRFALFDLLPESERQNELRKLKMLRYGAGEVIYERRGDCMDVFFIFEGLVRVDSFALRGQTAFFHYRRPGQMVGYYAAMTGKSQPVTASAAQPALLGRMAAADFRGLVLSWPPLSAYMLQLGFEMLRRETDRLRQMILFDAPERIASELIACLEETGGSVVHIEDREEFAARLGMSRETLSRHLSQLQRRGLVMVKGHDIHILEAAQLAEMIS